MSLWLIVLIVVAAAVIVLGVVIVGRRAPSGVLREQLRKTDPKSVEDLDQVAATIRNPLALPMHDRSFDRPR